MAKKGKRERVRKAKMSNVMKLVPAETVYKCVCGRTAPEPGFAPLGDFLAHCEKYHPRVQIGPSTHYCRKCKLMRVKAHGAWCDYCIREQQIKDHHRELQTRDAFVSGRR